MERLLGQWVAIVAWRDDVVIHRERCAHAALRPESIVRQLGETLDRLQSGHVDLYLMPATTRASRWASSSTCSTPKRAPAGSAASAARIGPYARFEEAQAYAKANGKQAFSALSDHFGLAHALDVPGPAANTSPSRRTASGSAHRHAAAPVVVAGARILRTRDRADTSGRGTGSLLLQRRQLRTARPGASLGKELGRAPTAVALASFSRSRSPRSR